MRVKIPVVVDVPTKEDVAMLLRALRPSHFMAPEAHVNSIQLLASEVQVLEWVPYNVEDEDDS